MENSSRNLKKVSQVFLVVLKGFLFFNTFMFGFALYNLSHSPPEMFKTNFWLFLLFLGNFWVLMFLLLLVSFCMKICMLAFEPNLDDVPRLLPLIQAFMSGEEEDSDEELVAHISLMETDDNRPPATNDQLLNLEVKWGEFFCPIEERLPETEKCVICLQKLETGVICLACNCRNYFHKKCMIEWFHFNEKEEEGSKFVVSCPSCRHQFETK